MTIAFIGNKKITITNELIKNIHDLVETLINNEQADVFLFGSNSEFNDICYDIVTELKENYPHIKRIYVRAEYEYINNDYKNYLLSKYEDTFYPDEVHNAGYKAYIKRNQVMIKMCDKLIAYHNKNYIPTHRFSGTQIAINYARQLKKSFLNIYNN